MRKIGICLAALLAISGLFLLSCSKKDANSGQTAEKVKLVYWSMWNETEPQAQSIAAAIEEFSQKTGIEVEVNWNGREIRKTLQPALDAGKVIDLFDEDIERVNRTWGNYIFNMEEYASKVYDTTNGQPYKDVINKTLVNLAQSLGPNGALSSIPYQPSAFLMMYNKALFEKAGITAVPQTWEELLDVCATLKANGITPITIDDAYIPALVGYHMARLIGHEATLSIVDNDDWSNDAVIQLGTDWAEMAAKGYISKNAQANIWPQGQQEIATESVAMYLNGTWLPNEIKGSTRPDFAWGSFAYPAVHNGVEAGEANHYGSQCFAINKNSKYSEEAFKLIVFLTTGKWDTELAKNSIGVPMGNASTWPPQLADAKAVIDATTIRYPWAVGMENNADQTARIKTNFALLIGGKLTPVQFAENMQKK